MIKFIAMILASACALAAGADTARVSLKLRGRGEEGGGGEGGVNVQVSVGKVNEDYDELLSGGWCSGHIDQNDQHELTLPFNEDHNLPYPGNYYRVIRAGALCDPSDSPSGPITNDQCQSGTGTQCLPIGNDLKCCVIPQDGACKSGADYCQPPNKCVNGECAIPAPPPPAPKPMPTQRRIPTYIPAGGTCIVGGTPCITGYSCVDGKCAIPYVIPTYIPAGGTCIVGGTPCITGYSCVDAICIIRQGVPMPTCGVSLEYLLLIFNQTYFLILVGSYNLANNQCTVNCNCYNNDCGGW